MADEIFWRAPTAPLLKTKKPTAKDKKSMAKELRV
jgi:hypothetical protein